MEYQRLEPFNFDDGFQAWDNVEDMTRPGSVIADNILGLGSKKKKVDKKIRKANIALKKGDIKKAERKLGKAQRKSDTIDTANKVSAVQAKIDAITPQSPTPLPQPKTIDPTTLADAPNVPGSGLSFPLGSGGGSDNSGGGSGAQMLDEGGAQQDTTGTPTDIKDDGTKGLTDVTIMNKKFNPVIVAVFLFLVVGIIIYLKRKK